MFGNKKTSKKSNEETKVEKKLYSFYAFQNKLIIETSTTTVDGDQWANVIMIMISSNIMARIATGHPVT